MIYSQLRKLNPGASWEAAVSALDRNLKPADIFLTSGSWSPLAIAMQCPCVGSVRFTGSWSRRCKSPVGGQPQLSSKPGYPKDLCACTNLWNLIHPPSSRIAFDIRNIDVYYHLVKLIIS